jgi:hypothetical protein
MPIKDKSRLFEKIGKRMALDSESRVSVGFFQGSVYDDGTPVASVAIKHEFGDVNVPPRPFFRPAIEKNYSKWGGIFFKSYSSNFRINDSLNAVGLVASGDIALSIKNVTNPKLSKSTISRKGFDKPLVDTGLMLGAVTHEVSS